MILIKILIEKIVLIVACLIISKVEQSITQDEFVDDQGRYIFDAPASFRNRNKNSTNSNSIVQILSTTSRSTTVQAIIPSSTTKINIPTQTNFPNNIPIVLPEPSDTNFQQLNQIETTRRPNQNEISNPRRQLSTVIRLCVHKCPTTSEFNPVCGTDGISYVNLQKLTCAKGCGQDVQRVRQGRCRPFAPIQF